MKTISLRIDWNSLWKRNAINYFTSEPEASEFKITAVLPQEAFMVQEFRAAHVIKSGTQPGRRENKYRGIRIDFWRCRSFATCHAEIGLHLCRWRWNWLRMLRFWICRSGKCRLFLCRGNRLLVETTSKSDYPFFDLHRIKDQRRGKTLGVSATSFLLLSWIDRFKRVVIKSSWRSRCISVNEHRDSCEFFHPTSYFSHDPFYSVAAAQSGGDHGREAEMRCFISSGGDGFQQSRPLCAECVADWGDLWFCNRLTGSLPVKWRIWHNLSNFWVIPWENTFRDKTVHFWQM